MNATDAVRVERSGGVARLTLDRPPLNILDIAMLEELDAVLADVAQDASVGVVVLTGAGRAFCAGVDVADHMEGRAERMLRAFRAVIGRIFALEPPVVAAVNGAALGGGCELLLACDFVLARETAKLGQPEIRLGVFPPAAAALLPARIGYARALDLILTGRTLHAAEAHGLGLVTRVFTDDAFAAGVDAFVAGLAALSPPVVRLAKRATAIPASSIAERLDAADRLYAHELMRLADAHEGLAAFLEKRSPVWKGA